MRTINPEITPATRRKRRSPTKPTEVEAGASISMSIEDRLMSLETQVGRLSAWAWGVAWKTVVGGESQESEQHKTRH